MKKFVLFPFICVVFCALIIVTSGSFLAEAQTVDPCWYGCPKSGCPQCPEGGPIKAKESSEPQTTSGETCVKGCQNNNRDRVRDCDIYYPPQNQPVKHRECLDKAKTIFDACMATCQ